MKYDPAVLDELARTFAEAAVRELVEAAGAVLEAGVHPWIEPDKASRSTGRPAPREEASGR